LELAEIDRSKRKPTESLDAVDLYYRAIHFKASYPKDMKMLCGLPASDSLDPNFAAAYG